MPAADVWRNPGQRTVPQLTADLAIARRDWDCIYTASERLLELQRNWAALYRRLLVIRVEPSRIFERTSV